MQSTAKKTEQLPDLPERLQTVFPPPTPHLPDQVVSNSLQIKKQQQQQQQTTRLVSRGEESTEDTNHD